ncbi:MAG: hypothetical protein PHE25_03665 [Candidatus Gracilibacteria bacterium]|nr:hypothetical protein [Candidatus Gracilibacteria bacterium]
MVTIIDDNICVNKNTLEEYSIFIDVVSHERDKIFGNYIESNNYNDLVNYLDN